MSVDDFSREMYDACLLNDKDKISFLINQIPDDNVNGVCKRPHGFKSLLHEAMLENSSPKYGIKYWLVGIVFVGGRGDVEMLKKILQHVREKYLFAAVL